MIRASRLLSIIVFLTKSFNVMSQPDQDQEQYFIYVLDLKEPYRDPANWTPEIIALAEAHHTYFVELEKQGKLIIAGRSKYEVDNPKNFGIMVFKASSMEEAEKIRLNDPGVKGELMNARLHPFSIAVLKTDYD